MKEIPILTIPAGIFGRYDTGAMINLVQKTLREHKPQPSKAEVVASAFENGDKDPLHLRFQQLPSDPHHLSVLPQWDNHYRR